MTVPAQPKIYHIVHVDRLPSIIKSNGLWCDAEMEKHPDLGTTIGMSDIKKRRLKELTLTSHPELYVGQCVPFYFCPRSVMLYVICRGNHPGLSYHGGQDPIIHIEADLRASVTWADANNKRWAFTLSNAGSRYFEDHSNLAKLNEINWEAVQANQWDSIIEDKQAEFLMEHKFPWHLIERIGVCTKTIYQKAANAFPTNGHRPKIEVCPDWYY